MACNKNEWHPVHWIIYWISTVAKIPSTEQDGGINVMSMGRNGFTLAWMTTTTLNWSHKFHSWISTEDIEDKLNNVYYIL
jgi:hypothetical protein